MVDALGHVPIIRVGANLLVSLTGDLVHSETDLVVVRSLLRSAAEAGELSTVEMTKFITAGSELARNIVTYARDSGGMVTAGAVTEADRCGVRAVFSDHGPGIPDIDQ